MRAWHLPAASGRNRLSGAFEEQWTDEHGSTVLKASIQLEGQFWPRSKEYKEKNLLVDFSVALPQVLLRKESVELLISHLERWLNERKEISIELGDCERNDQSFHVSFVDSSGSKSTLEKTTCTIHYSGGVFAHGEWSFVVDHTCIDIFLRELQASLETK